MRKSSPSIALIGQAIQKQPTSRTVADGTKTICRQENAADKLNAEDKGWWEQWRKNPGSTRFLGIPCSIGAVSDLDDLLASYHPEILSI
jgi:hypothetical protein